MKIFSASIAAETNTFAPAPTGMAAFEAFGLFHAKDSLQAPEGVAALRHLKSSCERRGHELVPGLCAFAEPAGRIVRETYEALRDELLEDLRQAMPVDAVFLFLHGAMAADGYDDCEGDILARVRQIVGERVPVGAELDLHCHLTPQMLESADALIAYKEYPHTDVRERADELLDLLLATARGEVRPVTAMHDCKMVGLWRTSSGPMRDFVDRMKAVERQPGVLSVSLGHGFPWGDVADCGARLWVVTDGDAALAQRLTDQLGREFWALRDATRQPGLEIEAALDQALAIDGGPVVLADTADNPGGGAMSDSSFLLRALVERGVRDVAIGAFWDLGAIQMCVDAGVGARLELRVGGKCGPASGLPVDLQVTVRAIRDEHQQDVFGASWPMGRSVWVESEGGIHLLLCSLRGQIYGTDAFTGIGITLQDKRLIVIKGTQHFYAAFSPLAKATLYVDSPGALTSRFEEIAYRNRSLRYWPRAADPHS
ncbi:M81 family metallopeptidase [Roseateles violae]|uniref:Microcystinase C n=1 Tax=Roseateles violae TaxID=3058042 RepID=A0ABT8DZZ9_9BURK|nr:M81 family metallopeptidase [Pelomonas sp. PFR6]MDN3923193.1 M81 family metallopeptidase [Pelomonas sp. PFR6]